MSKWSDAAAGVIAIALATVTLLPRRSSTAEMLAAVGKSQAGMMRAMLGPIRCDREIRWPGNHGTWLRNGCVVVGDHELHVTIDGRAFTNGDIEWFDIQYRLTMTDG